MIFAAWASLVLRSHAAGIRTFDCTIVGGIGGQVANFLMVCRLRAGDYYFDTCRTGLVSTEDFITHGQWHGYPYRRGSGVSTPRPQSEKMLAVRFTPLPARCVPVWEHNRSHRRRSSVCMGLGWRLKF